MKSQNFKRTLKYNFKVKTCIRNLKFNLKEKMSTTKKFFFKNKFYKCAAFC